MAALWLAQAASPIGEIGSPSSELFDYLKLLAILGIILVLAYVALRVWLPRLGAMRKFASGPIQVAARLTLEPRKSLYIVRAGGEYFLVGTSETGMHYLTRLDPGRAEETIGETEPVSEREFASLISAFKRPKRSP